MPQITVDEFDTHQGRYIEAELDDSHDEREAIALQMIEAVNDCGEFSDTVTLAVDGLETMQEFQIEPSRYYDDVLFMTADKPLFYEGCL